MKTQKNKGCLGGSKTGKTTLMRDLCLSSKRKDSGFYYHRVYS